MSHAKNPTDREKTLTSAVLFASNSLGLSKKQLTKAIGIALEDGDFLEEGTMPFEKGFLLVKLHRSLSVIFDEDNRCIRAWMRADDDVLGEKPINLIMEIEGLIDVAAYGDERRVMA